MHSRLRTLGKNADRSGPISPIVTADEVGDPADGLRLVSRINGEVVQDGNTADMIFPVGDILAYVSEVLTLAPGDVICTETPAGSRLQTHAAAVPRTRRRRRSGDRAGRNPRQPDRGVGICLRGSLRQSHRQRRSPLLLLTRKRFSSAPPAVRLGGDQSWEIGTGRSAKGGSMPTVSDAPTQSSFDSAVFRTVIGTVTSGVVVLTSRDDDGGVNGAINGCRCWPGAGSPPPRPCSTGSGWRRACAAWIWDAVAAT